MPGGLIRWAILTEGAALDAHPICVSLVVLLFAAVPAFSADAADPDEAGAVIATFPDILFNRGSDSWLMKANGLGQRLLVTDGRGASASPNGLLIAFHREIVLDGDIFLMNADGSNLTNLTNHPDSDTGPVISPDGTKVLFNSFRDGNAEIYVMNMGAE